MKKILLVLILISLFVSFVFATSISWTTTPNDAISNSLSAVKDGGSTTSQDFSFEPNQTLKSTHFADDGFDAHSVIFDFNKDRFKNLEVGLSEDFSFSYMVNGDIQSFKANSIVVCEQTGEDLEETIEMMKITTQVSPTDLCGVDEYQPCCLVYFNKYFGSSSGSSYTQDPGYILISILALVIVLGIPSLLVFLLIYLAYKNLNNSKRLMGILGFVSIPAVLLFVLVLISTLTYYSRYISPNYLMGLVIFSIPMIFLVIGLFSFFKKINKLIFAMIVAQILFFFLIFIVGFLFMPVIY